MDQHKMELMVEIKRINNENQKLKSMINLLSINCNNLQTQLIKQQEESLKSSLKSMAKTLKLGIPGDIDIEACGEQVIDSGSARSESSVDNSSQYSIEDGHLHLPCKKRKINYAVQQSENDKDISCMDGNKSFGVVNKEAGYSVVPELKKIITVRTRSDATTVNDGCHWRKYGQKMTINNLWPRSYYKCTFPTCGVKKKVQKCDQDPTIVTITYEGEHNHLLSKVAIVAMNGKSDGLQVSSSAAGLTEGIQLPFPASIATISSMGSCPTVTLDFMDNVNTKLNPGLHPAHQPLAKRGFPQHKSPLYATNMHLAVPRGHH